MRMLSSRVHLLLEPSERERFVRAADRCGESLSTWLRRAGRERLEREDRSGVMSVSELRAFFADCNARDDGVPEPDWDEQKRVIECSVRSGAGDAGTTDSETPDVASCETRERGES